MSLTLNRAELFELREQLPSSGRDIDVPALAAAARHALARGLSQEARDMLAGALVVDPDCVEAWVAMAESLVALDQLEAARLAYRNAISLPRAGAETILAFAELQSDTGELEEAEALLISLATETEDGSDLHGRAAALLTRLTHPEAGGAS